MKTHFMKYFTIIILNVILITCLTNNSEAQTNSSVAGIYNNWEMNFQLRLEGDGTLEFYTATSYTPYVGIWRKSGNTITISIPDYASIKVEMEMENNSKNKNFIVAPFLEYTMKF